MSSAHLQDDEVALQKLGEWSFRRCEASIKNRTSVIKGGVGHKFTPANGNIEIAKLVHVIL